MLKLLLNCKLKTFHIIKFTLTNHFIRINDLIKI